MCSNVIPESATVTPATPTGSRSTNATRSLADESFRYRRMTSLVTSHSETQQIRDGSAGDLVPRHFEMTSA